MADIFISYSKRDQALAPELAREFEAKGYSVWWDTGLVAGEAFEDTIMRELEAARAVLVVWTPHSVNSMWVRSEARRASEQGKLVALRTAELDVKALPPPFDGYQTAVVSDATAIYAALEKLGVEPSYGQEQAHHDTLAGEEWDRIKSATDIADLERFETHFSWTRFAMLARSRRDELEFTKAAELDTLDALARYGKLFPQGRFLAQSRVRGAELSFAQAEAAATVEAYEKHIADWPGGPLERKAKEWLARYAYRRQLIDDLIAKGGDEAKSADAEVGAFLATLPSAERGFWGTVAAERVALARAAFAKKRSDWLDDDAWERARQHNTIDAYAAYAREFTAGRNGDRALEAWDKLLHTASYGGMKSPMLGVSLLHEGSQFVTLSSSNLTLWTKSQPQPTEIAAEKATCIASNSQRRVLGLGRPEGPIIVRQYTTPRKADLKLEGHVGPVRAVGFSPDGNLLLSGGTDRTLRLWKIADGLFSWSGKQLWSKAFTTDISAVEFSPDARTFAYSFAGGDIVVCDAASGKEIARHSNAGGWVFCYTRDSASLLIMTGGNTLAVWDYASRSIRAELRSIELSYSLGMASAGGGQLAVWTARDGLAIWNIGTGNLRVVRGYPGYGGPIVVAPDGSFALSVRRENSVSSANASLEQWDLRHF